MKLIIKTVEDLKIIKTLIRARTDRCTSIEKMIRNRKDANGTLTREDIEDLRKELNEHFQWLSAAEAGIGEFLKPPVWDEDDDAIWETLDKVWPEEEVYA